LQTYTSNCLALIVEMKKIDLNCDMAELVPGYSTNFDSEIMPYISSCNIACGFHSGNPVIIKSSIQSAISHGVKIGAHPSYNDSENFGRKSIQVDLKVLLAELRYQISAVKGSAESLGGKLNHVKPHGALYNDIAKDSNLAIAIVKLIKEIDPRLKIYGLAESHMKNACKEYKMEFVAEGFADRRYQKRAELRSRSLEGAVISKISEVVKQLDLFSKGKVELHDGKIEDLRVETLCLHSDTEGAVQLSKTIHDFFTKNNITVG